MRMFLIIGKNSPKAKKNPGDCKTVSGPSEDRAAIFDKFFERVEKDDRSLQEIQLISTTEGLERRHIFDPIE